MPEVSPEPPADLVRHVGGLLGLKDATNIADEARRLYEERLTKRFTEIKLRDRIKRTNPFLLQIRDITTVTEWAERQVGSALLASEEEAVGHLLEAIAKACHPDASQPRYPDDFDYEVCLDDELVEGYQVKLSWDCMPMSSRKNLSNTIKALQEQYAEESKEFVGYFAPCYGKATTTSPPGQAYVSLSSREFWTKVGKGDQNFDQKVGEAVSLICGEFRKRLQKELVPKLVTSLTRDAEPMIGGKDGHLDMAKLLVLGRRAGRALGVLQGHLDQKSSRLTGRHPHELCLFAAYSVSDQAVPSSRSGGSRPGYSTNQLVASEVPRVASATYAATNGRC